MLVHWSIFSGVFSPVHGLYAPACHFIGEITGERGEEGTPDRDAAPHVNECPPGNSTCQSGLDARPETLQAVWPLEGLLLRSAERDRPEGGLCLASTFRILQSASHWLDQFAASLTAGRLGDGVGAFPELLRRVPWEGGGVRACGPV